MTPDPSQLKLEIAHPGGEPLSRPAMHEMNTAHTDRYQTCTKRARSDSVLPESAKGNNTSIVLLVINLTAELRTLPPD